MFFWEGFGARELLVYVSYCIAVGFVQRNEPPSLSSFCRFSSPWIYIYITMQVLL